MQPTSIGAMSNTPTIAFLGPRGTFTEQAALEFLRAGQVPGVPASSVGTDPESAATLEPRTSPAEALGELREGRADYAVIALESSVDGPVAQAEDALVTGDRVQILAELLVPIRFGIGVRAGEAERFQGSGAAAAGAAAPVFSTHPVAEAQVRGWVAENLPEVQFSPAPSNAAAAQAVAEGQADICAAPLRALELYGLEAIATDVADVAEAFTRFALVSRPVPPAPRTGHDRTGVAFTAQHDRPGSLIYALQQLSLRGVNLTRISSRPTRELLGTYVFHIEMIGHIEDSAVAAALQGLQRESSWIRYLGSWPLATAPRGVDEEHLVKILGNVTSEAPDEGPSERWLADMMNPAEDHRA